MAIKISKQRIEELVSKINPLGGEAIADLVASDALDSLSMAELQVALETELGIVFRHSDLSPAHFRNVETISNLLRARYDCEIG